VKQYEITEFPGRFGASQHDMSVELRIPKLGMGMTEGKLVEWLAPDGAKVEEGKPIYALETEKSIQEIEAPVSGMLRISAVINETYEVGTLIGSIE
jgi:pyruvate/2-oxoglutarate dehydrogenase complex dihydrolipoamide acyltransferase (E2) component